LRDRRALQQSGDLLILDGARDVRGRNSSYRPGQPMLNKTLAPFSHGSFGPAATGFAIRELLSPLGRPQHQLGAKPPWGVGGEFRERAKLRS